MGVRDHPLAHAPWPPVLILVASEGTGPGQPPAGAAEAQTHANLLEQFGQQCHLRALPRHLLLGGKGPRLLETRRRARSRPRARDKLQVPQPILLGGEREVPATPGVPAGSSGEGGGRAGQRGGGQAAAPTRRHPLSPPPRGAQAAGTRGRGAGEGSRPPGRGRARWPRRWVGAPAAPSPGPRPPSPAASEPPLAPPRAARGKFLQLRGGGGGRPGPRSRPAPRGQAPGRRRPNSPPGPAGPRPALCAAARGARRPGPRPGHKRARGRRGRACEAHGPGRAGGRGPGRRPGPATLTCRGTSPCRRRTRS